MHRPLRHALVLLVLAALAQGGTGGTGGTAEARRGEPPSEDGGELWWSLRPLQAPVLPAVNRGLWCRNPIDQFILAALERKGLRPAPEADRRTFIRRATFDMHGLPPTPGEIETFLKDGSADAFEKLVDRLLASARYGERWARFWLDIIHYADTHGFDKDKRRLWAWLYRDWLIGALNEDVPYRRFVRYQVAGDVLYPDDPAGVVATGFIAAGPWDFVGHVELREGTVEKEKTRNLDRDDMVANTMSTFVSLTAHCARCHDHKFDPISQTDYYRLQAVFAGLERGDRPVWTATERRQRLLLQQRRAGLLARRDQTLTRLLAPAARELARHDSRLKELKAQLAAVPPLPPGKPSPSNGYHSGIDRKADVTKWVQVDLGRPYPLDAIQLFPARPTDFPDTPGFGFPIRFEVSLANDASHGRAEIVASHTGADFANPGDSPYVIKLSGKTARFIRVTARRLWRRTNDFVFALAELRALSGKQNVAAGRPATALDTIEAGRWSTRYLTDNYDSRQELPDASNPQAAKVLWQRAQLERQIRKVEQARAARTDSLLTPAARASLDGIDAELEHLSRRLSERPRATVFAVVPRAPRPIHVLRRGDVERKGKLVDPGALSLVPGLPGDWPRSNPNDEGARRAGLADWLSSDRNGLTWRSIANRLWQYHFGRGLVDTPNDFGKNGALPSHPELLDWLACRVRDGASLKQMHRLLLLSAAYRQSCTHDPANARIDGDNRYLWRMNRQRLDAEALRDSVLHVSGQLRQQMGGPGYELFRYKDDHSPVYDHGVAEVINNPANSRRTLYRFVVRSVANPFLDSLDCADPNISVPVRNKSITALQALALLNNPFMVKQSELFARRLAAQGGNTSVQVDRAFELALGRRPTDQERSVVADYAQRHGLARACRLLFNCNEFLFVD